MLVLTQALAVGPKRWAAADARRSCSEQDSCEVRGVGGRRKADAAMRGEDSTQQYHGLREPWVFTVDKCMIARVHKKDERE